MKNNSKKYEIDMLNGPIVSKLLIYSGPLILSSILQLLFNAADVIVVGRFSGDNALAAVGSVGSVTNFIINLFLGLSIGTSVAASKFFGARDEKRFKSILHTSISIGAVIGLILGAFGIICAHRILVWMNSPAEVIDLATLYLRIYFIGIPAQAVYNFGSAVLRSIGDTKRPLYYLTVAGIVNVVLNLVFVVGFKMSVDGVAIATIISQYISVILVIRCLIKEDGILKLDLRKLSIEKDALIQIVGIGVPASLQGIMFSISNIIIQSSVNSFGAIVVAGNSAASNVEGFVYVSMNAFYQACMTFVSQNVGGRKFERINPIVIRAEICVTAVGLILGQIVYHFGYPLLSLYTDSQAVKEAGIIRMACIVVPYCLCGMMDVMTGAIRGLGYAIMPMIVTLIGVCGLRLFWIFTFFRMPMFHETKYLYLTYPVSWAITFIVHIICFVIVRKGYEERTLHPFSYKYRNR